MCAALVEDLVARGLTERDIATLPSAVALPIREVNPKPYNLIAVSIYDKYSISPVYSTNLHQMLFLND